MNEKSGIQLVLLLILFNSIFYAHSASSSSALATSVKYKSPKLDKTIGNRKNKGGSDDDVDGEDDGGKFVEQ